MLTMFAKIMEAQEQGQNPREFLVQNGWGNALEAFTKADARTNRVSVKGECGRGNGYVDGGCK